MNFVLLFSMLPQLWAQTTYNLPNASIHDDSVSFSVGAGIAALRAGPLPSVRTSFSYDQGNWGMYLTNTIYQGQKTEGFDVLSLRYLIGNTDRIRIAPTLTMSDHWGISNMDYRWTTRMGLALETGQNKWLWDLSINVVGWQYRPLYTNAKFSKMTGFDTLLTLESGLRYEIKEGHFFRLGLLGPLPAFRYVIPLEKGSLEITGATQGTQNVLHVDFRL